MIAVPMRVSVSNVNIPAGIGAEYIFTSADYEKLKNIPQINGREIIGNKTVAYYLQDGLILNGGDATGYPEPVIPPGVPQAEGVAF